MFALSIDNFHLFRIINFTLERYLTSQSVVSSFRGDGGGLNDEMEMEEVLKATPSILAIIELLLLSGASAFYLWLISKKGWKG